MVGGRPHGNPTAMEDFFNGEAPSEEAAQAWRQGTAALQAIDKRLLLRADSKIARAAVEDQARAPSRGEVADMAITQLLYLDTTYHAHHEAQLREIADKLKEQVPELSWTQIWRIVKRHGPIMLKMAAVSQLEISSVGPG